MQDSNTCIYTIFCLVVTSICFHISHFAQKNLVPCQKPTSRRRAFFLNFFSFEIIVLLRLLREKSARSPLASALFDFCKKQTFKIQKAQKKIREFSCRRARHILPGNFRIIFALFTVISSIVTGEGCSLKKKIK